MKQSPFPIAVLISGSGSNLQALIDAIDRGVLDARICVVVANKADAYGLDRARSNGIPVVVISHKEYPQRELFDARLVDVLRQYGIEAVADSPSPRGAVILAGFMRILSPVFVDAFKERILNIHPALLPAFAGKDGQGDACNYGVRISGCTVHFVDLEMDSGPIVIQAAVPVLQQEDRQALADRILAMEHRIYPQAVQWLVQGRLSISGRQVLLEGNSDGAVALDSRGFLISPALEEGF